MTTFDNTQAITSITIELCGKEIHQLNAMKAAYQEQCDDMLLKRGFKEAVGKFTHFRLSKGNLEIHVEGLGSTGCSAREGDIAFVDVMTEQFIDIKNQIAAIKAKATNTFNIILDEFLS